MSPSILTDGIDVASQEPMHWRGRWSFYREHYLAMATRWLDVDRELSHEPPAPLDALARRIMAAVRAIDAFEEARVADSARRERAREAFAALHEARAVLATRLRGALGARRLPDIPREPNGRLPRTGRLAIEAAVALTELALAHGHSAHPDVLELQRRTRDAIALDLDADLDDSASSRREERDATWRALQHDVRVFVPQVRLTLCSFPERAAHYRLRRPEQVGDRVRTRRSNPGGPERPRSTEPNGRAGSGP